MSPVPSARSSGDRDDDIVRSILAIVFSRTGLDFSTYRSATIRRRIATRMTAMGVRTLGDYLQILEGSADETLPLIERMTIKVSRFYRNTATFEHLRAQVLPELARTRRGAPLRLWSAGCGHGEEAYTLAMLLEEAGIPGTVEGTDIDPRALEVAGAAVYPGEAISELPSDLTARYLERCEGGARTRYRVQEAVRERVRCSSHDITANGSFPYGGAFDLVSCRNVLIYLERSVQAEAIRSLQRALVPGGFLCLGEAEWPPAFSAPFLEPLDYKSRIFRAVAYPPDGASA